MKCQRIGKCFSWVSVALHKYYGILQINIKTFQRYDVERVFQFFSVGCTDLIEFKVFDKKTLSP